MRTMVFSLFVALQSTMASAALYCTPDSPYKNFCDRMVHLRATINVLDSQAWVPEINFPLMTKLSESLLNNTKTLNTIIPDELNDHKEGLQQIYQMAEALRNQSTNKNPLVREAASYVKYQCLNCHTTSNPRGGAMPWNDVFGFNWDEVAQRCDQFSANPYICKSMNAMATDYSHLSTSHLSKIENFEITSSLVEEIVRVLRDLKTKNISHFPENLSVEVEKKAEEVIALANKKDPTTFQKALDLNNSCMKCHNEAYPLNRGIIFSSQRN